MSDEHVEHIEPIDPIEQNIEDDYNDFISILLNKYDSKNSSDSINDIINSILSKAIPAPEQEHHKSKLKWAKSWIPGIFMFGLYISVTVFNPIAGICLLPLIGHYAYLMAAK